MTEPVNNQWIDEIFIEYDQLYIPTFPDESTAEKAITNRNNIQNARAYAKQAILSKLESIEQEARVDGQQELVNIGIERLKNDEYYTLQAFIEDSQEYLNRVGKG